MVFMLYTVYCIAWFFFLGWCFVWFLHITAILNGKLKFHKKIYFPSPEIPLPGVSILKPLVGVDSNLLSNLETFFTMHYPLYELLFCIDNESDPSIMLVYHLMQKYPLVDAKVFIGGKEVGVNPKINNLQPGYEAAKYDLILISDSGMKTKEDTLMDMVCSMKDNVGLVHQMPFTCDGKDFPTAVQKVFFGTAHARIYLAADFYGFNCATGMSALMRKKPLDEVGGIKAFSNYLAEDYFFAKSFTERGWKLCISSQPGWQNSGTCDISGFQQRMTRWAKLRIAMVPLTIIFEPLSECLLLGVCAALSINFLFHCDVFAIYLIHVLLWFFLDWILLSVIQNGSLPFSKTDFVSAWAFREFSALYLFSKALFDPDIRWRTGTYRLKWGGIVEKRTKL